MPLESKTSFTSFKFARNLFTLISIGLILLNACAILLAASTPFQEINSSASQRGSDSFFANSKLGLFDLGSRRPFSLLRRAVRKMPLTTGASFFRR